MISYEELSRRCHSVATLLEAGIDIQQALVIVGRQCKNRRLSDAMRRCEAQLSAGSSLSAAMKKEKCLPVLLKTLVEVGEETGHLDTVFGELAAFFELKLRLWRGFLKNITMHFFGSIGILK